MAAQQQNRRLAVGDLIHVARADGQGQTEISEVFSVQGQFVFVQCANGIVRCHQLDDLVPGEPGVWQTRGLRLAYVPEPPAGGAH